MSIRLKGFLYTGLVFGIVYIPIIGLLWLIMGHFTNLFFLIAAVIASLLSPRYKVVSLQSGKSLQVSGLLINVYEAFVNRTKRKKESDVGRHI